MISRHRSHHWKRLFHSDHQQRLIRKCVEQLGSILVETQNCYYHFREALIFNESSLCCSVSQLKSEQPITKVYGNRSNSLSPADSVKFQIIDLHACSTHILCTKQCSFLFSQLFEPVKQIFLETRTIINNVKCHCYFCCTFTVMAIWDNKPSLASSSHL